MSKVSKKLSLHIGSEISLENFSFSQLIIAVKKLFDTEGIPGFIRTLIILVETILLKSGVSCPRCNLEKNHLHGHTNRKIKTSIGIVHLADGTGFKKDKDAEGSNRGQIKVIIGYNNDGSVYPFGAWTRASWQDLGNLLKRSNQSSDKIKFKPIAGTLITDGEEELVRRLKNLLIVINVVYFI
jgi:hypothetical protein